MASKRERLVKCHLVPGLKRAAGSPRVSLGLFLTLQQSNKFRAFGCRKLLIMLALSVKKLIVVEFERLAGEAGTVAGR
jgi:hypothetical protein